MRGLMHPGSLVEAAGVPVLDTTVSGTPIPIGGTATQERSLAVRRLTESWAGTIARFGGSLTEHRRVALRYAGGALGAITGGFSGSASLSTTDGISDRCVLNLRVGMLQMITPRGVWQVAFDWSAGIDPVEVRSHQAARMVTYGRALSVEEAMRVMYAM